MVKKLSDEQVLSVVKRYGAGESGNSIAEDMHVSDVAIYGLLKRRGITRRTPIEAGRRITANHNRFDTLDEEAQYWCGLLAADGTIVRRSGSPELALVLAGKDVGHVRKFRDFLGSGHTITEFTHTNSWGTFEAARFSIRSAGLCDRLESLGIKGPILSDLLTESSHFWRGVVDGDGSVGSNTSKPRVELVGYRYLLDPFAEYTAKHTGTSANVFPSKSIFRYQVGGSTAAKMLDLLYGHGGVSLDRKQERADRLRLAVADPVEAITHRRA